jgi:HNH endonuclease
MQMYDRFTRTSRIGRGKIRKDLREEIYRRDGYTCQFCGTKPRRERLSIDHLVPIALGGVDEKTNYVTSCQACNELKAALPLSEFVKQIRIDLEALPVHGDTIIDNLKLPIEIRLLRKRIFVRIRSGELKSSGKSYQKKLEKAYRREFWQTSEGKMLEAQFPNLPSQVRVMLPEIQTIANNQNDYLLLLELAKSAKTRNLIGSAISGGRDVEETVRALANKTTDEALKKRLEHALTRFAKVTGFQRSVSADN